MNTLLTAFRVMAAVAFPLSAGLAATGVVLWVLDRRSARLAADNHAEWRARTEAGMPPYHPERLTRMLAPHDEMYLRFVAEQMDPEAAE